MTRAVFAILSTENLLHNLAVIKKQAPNSGVIAMVKANAYGHGLRSTALRLENQVSSVGVASIDEAIALRKAGVKVPITLMEGVFEPDELLVASCEQFHVVFHSMYQIEWLETYSLLPLPITAWLKVDTGMGRLGFSLEDAVAAYERLAGSKQVKLPIGCMSHFACADEKSHMLNQVQIDNFVAFTRAVSAGNSALGVSGSNISNGTVTGIKSFCNSAAIFAFPEHQYDMVRPGLALYGVSPFAQISAAQLGLKPVMTLQTRLIAIKMMRKGATLGYGARFVCPEDMPVGIIAMGYGDGYPRSARDGTPVLVKGVRCALIGRVSMDMMTIDLRNCPQAREQDLVILWGEGLPLESVAPHTDNSPYDILTSVQLRVKFYWTQNGAVNAK